MARITRICSAVAAVAIFCSGSAQAKRSDPSALGLYARARIGGGGDTVKAYSAALTAAPQEPTVAFHAFRQAIVSGDFALSLRAAQALQRAGLVPPEARLIFYIAALRDRDWKAASVHLQSVADEQDFAFMVPILSDWLSLGGGEQVTGATRKTQGGVDIYGQESRALMMLARGDTAGGSILVKTLWPLDPYRAQSLRLTAAATLADRRERDAAIALLIADDVSTTSARSLIAKGRIPHLATNTPASGTAFLLSRMAGDLITEGSGRAAITLARLAQFADPQNPRIALIAAGALTAGKGPSETNRQIALALADRLRNDPIYGNDAASLRIDLLETLGQSDQAVAEARARAGNSVNDLARVGDIEARRGNFTQAAAIFRQILDTTPPADVTAALLFATGNALDQAGDWKAARPYLERALTMTPGNPVLLNELGYGLIEHGEDTARAVKFLTLAATTKPDSAAIMDSLGWADFKLGANDRAIANLERAVRLDNAEPEIGEHLGDAYWRGGRRVEARYSWAAARVQADGAMAKRLDAKIDRGLP